MPAVVIMPSDLLLDDIDDELALDVITAVLARAARFAPCILDESFTYADAARGVLIDVILRRYDARSKGVPVGSSRAETVGGRTVSEGASTAPATFWPGEIAELQALCAASAVTVPDPVTPAWSFPDAQPWPC